MTERDKSKLIWVVLLGLVVFCLLMAYRASGETLKGAEKLKHDARLSFYRAKPPPALPQSSAIVTANKTATLTLGWDASPSTNNLAYYQLGYGPRTEFYTNLTSAGLFLNISIGGIDPNGTYFFAVRAIANQWTNETSEWSNEVVWSGKPKTNNLVTIWTSLTNWTPVTLTNPVPNFFYRTLTTKLSANRYRTVAQRSPTVRGPWEEWTQYWTPVTNTTSTFVQMFSRYERQ